MQAAFQRQCSDAFIAAFRDNLSGSDFDRALWNYGFYSPVPLFRMEHVLPTPSPPLEARTNPHQATYNEVIGQGELTFSPIQMAWFYAAIANDGLAIPLKMVTAYETAANSNSYQAFGIDGEPQVLMSQTTATDMRSVLQHDTGVYWQHGVAYSGQPIQRLQWLTAIVDLENGNGSIVVVLVLENTTHPDEAVTLGVPILDFIRRSLEP